MTTRQQADIVKLQEKNGDVFTTRKQGILTADSARCGQRPRSFPSWIE